MTKTEKEILKFLDDLLNEYIDEYQRNRFMTQSMADCSRGKVDATGFIMNRIEEIIDDESRNDI